MVDLMMPVSPLEDVLVQGRYGRSLEQGPGVTLSLVHPCDVVSVIASKGKARTLATAAKKDFGLTIPDMGKSSSARGMSAHCNAPDQWIVVAPGSAPGTLAPKLEARLSRLAMITDQSHGRVVMRLSGNRARDVLAKGTAMDLRPGSFRSGMCGATQIGHVGVTIACTGADSFDLIVGRTFAEGFWLGICELALEWGYEVR